MTTAELFEQGITEILIRLGSVLTLRTPQNTERDVLAVFTSIGQNDGALVNALGIEGKIIYCETLTPPPSKFDRFLVPNGRSYVIHDAHDMLVEGVIVGHKCVVKAS